MYINVLIKVVPRYTLAKQSSYNYPYPRRAESPVRYIHNINVDTNLTDIIDNRITNEKQHINQCRQNEYVSCQFSLRRMPYFHRPRIQSEYMKFMNMYSVFLFLLFEISSIFSCASLAASCPGALYRQDLMRCFGNGIGYFRAISDEGRAVAHTSYFPRIPSIAHFRSSKGLQLRLCATGKYPKPSANGLITSGDVDVFDEGDRFIHILRRLRRPRFSPPRTDAYSLSLGTNANPNFKSGTVVEQVPATAKAVNHHR